MLYLIPILYRLPSIGAATWRRIILEETGFAFSRSCLTMLNRQVVEQNQYWCCRNQSWCSSNKPGTVQLFGLISLIGLIVSFIFWSYFSIFVLKVVQFLVCCSNINFDFGNTNIDFVQQLVYWASLDKTSRKQSQFLPRLFSVKLLLLCLATYTESVWDTTNVELRIMKKLTPVGKFVWQLLLWKPPPNSINWD